MTYTAGIDVGASAVKTVLMEYGNGSGSKVLFKDCRRMLRRNPADVAEESLHDALEVVGISLPDVAYVASTGEGEMVRKKRGHFYSMTTHARGALFLYPEACAVMDLGALHGRAMKVNEKARVLSYQMTGPCASGSGQFTENITRYLGMPRRRRPALPPVAPPRAGLLRSARSWPRPTSSTWSRAASPRPTSSAASTSRSASASSSSSRR